MSTTVCDNSMEYSLLNIYNQLRIYDLELQDDNKIFNETLNLTRKSLFDYIHRLIQQLHDIKKEYELEFHYLDNENNKTCNDNQQRLEDLCILIDKDQNDREKVFKHFNQFKETFPMRPNMLRNIPKFYFENVQMDFFIRKSNQSTKYTNEIFNNNNDLISTETKVDHSSFPIILNEDLLLEEDQSLEQNSSYEKPINDNPRSLCSSLHPRIPIKVTPSLISGTSVGNDDAQIPSTSVKINGSIEHSHHRQDNSMTATIQPQLGSVSTGSTMYGSNNRVDISFQVPYENDRHSRLMAYNIHDNCLLIYSLMSHKLEYLSIQTRQINPIHLASNEPLVSLGYSTNHRCFYSISKQTYCFILFHLNGQDIQIDRQFELTHENKKLNSVIVGHIYENNLYILYNLSSEILMFGTYNVDESTFISSRKLENILYDEDEQLTYEIIDFAVNSSYVTFLTRLKTVDRFVLIIHDHDINQIFSFDLIDAKQPLSIVSTIKTSQSDTFDDENQFLLFINDPKSHFIHCCTYERYLLSIEVNSFAICSLNDGNLAIVANKDIRGLKVQDYLN